MQRPPILCSNKENAPHAQQKSPIKLKINYQPRQKHPQRTTSPLRQQPFNRKPVYSTPTEDFARPLSYKKHGNDRKRFDQSQVQPFSKLLAVENNVLTIMSHHNRESSTDFSMIRPVSIVDNRRAQHNSTKALVDADVVIEKNHKIENQSYFKSKNRENSKHLGFLAKVGNLDKMNNQINSLLSYVYQNKTAPKDVKKDEESSSYKPRYGLISQNAKQYERRITDLERPKQHEPIVSTFDVEIHPRQQTRQQRHDRTVSFNYEYSDQGQRQSSKSPYKMMESINDKSFENKTPKSIQKDLSPKYVQRSTKNLFDEFIGPLRTVKSQQITQSLTPSQSVQKLSKMTNNNPDLEFYYESLKKRDEKVESFKSKLLRSPEQSMKQFSGEAQHSNKGSYPLINDEGLSVKYRAPFRGTNQSMNFDQEIRNRAFNRNVLHEQSSDPSIEQHNRTPSKKNVFVTQEEIEIYKDINKLHHGANNQRTSSSTRLQKIQQRRHDVQAQLQQEMNRSKSQTPKNVLKEQKSNPTQKNQQSYSRHIYQISKCDAKRVSTNHNNGDESITLKIEQQIKKIKNELSDCKKEKNYLREKYGSMLSKQGNGVSQSQSHSKVRNWDKYCEKVEVQQFQHDRTYERQLERQSEIEQEKQRLRENEKLSYQPRYGQNEFNKQEVDERMYDSSENKRQYAEAFNEYPVQGFNQGLRNTLAMQSQITQKSQGACLYPNTNQQQQENQRQQNSQAIHHEKQESFTQHISNQQQSQRKHTPTNKQTSKEFEILLHKVQITKPETTKLGTLLAEKIEIDLRLRDQREKFMNSANSNKWNELKAHLQSRYGISMPTQQLEQLLTIAPQEHNPFSPTAMSSNRSSSTISLRKNEHSSSTQQIPLLCSLLTESLDFFQLKLLHRFSSSQLQKEHFTFKELDLNSKGYLSLEDLICFVNLHSGKFYRNRDIIFLVKSMMHLQQKNHSLAGTGGLQCYSSTKVVNENRLGYEFLWAMFTTNNE